MLNKDLERIYEKEASSQPGCSAAPASFEVPEPESSLVFLDVPRDTNPLESVSGPVP